MSVFFRGSFNVRQQNYLNWATIRLNDDKWHVGKMSFENSKLISDGFPSFPDDSTRQPSPPKNPYISHTNQYHKPSPDGRQEKARFEPLLVYNNTKRAVSPYQDTQKQPKKFKVWLPKDRRAYHRILSGYKIAQYYDRKLRFLTLTTSKAGRSHDLKEDTNTLIKRIRRKYKVFEYFRVRTNEGNGVVHLIFRGSFLPRSWVKRQWEDIHESWNVDIRACQRYHSKYVVNQYICDQHGYTRYSMSGLWLPKGAVAVWRGFCKWYYTEKLKLWDSYLYNWVVGNQQQTLPCGVS